MERASIEELIEYGLDKIDPKERVAISLKDLLYIYKTFEELNRFFHNPMHYPSIEDVGKFIGDRDKGILAIIGKVYYHVIDDMLPEKARQMLNDGELSSDAFPYYY